MTAPDARGANRRRRRRGREIVVGCAINVMWREKKKKTREKEEG